MANPYSVQLSQIVDEFHLEILRKSQKFDKRKIISASVNRPGLQLMGFYKYFDNNRVELIGKVEYTYLSELSHEEREKCFDELLSHPIPALILARSQEPFPECMAAAEKYDRTVLRTDQITGEFMSDLTSMLRVELSPRITRHGVLVEVYGEGVFLTGESGVGKSETAIELMKRGHRLIADDAVEIKKTGTNLLMGYAPELIRYYVEVRGIGVIDVRRLFGMSAVKDSQELDLVVSMEPWKEGMMYDRLGLEENFTNILNINVPTVTIPVTPGRNLAVIVEVAAMNNRHKKMGYNAAREFTEQINAHFDQEMAAAASAEQEDDEEEMPSEEEGPY